MTATVAQALDRATAELAAALDLTPGEARLEARVLAAAALSVAPVWLIAHDRDALAADQADRLAALLSRRLAGEPVAYLLGEREFYGRAFRVGPATLIPRPDTEQLVDAALARAGPGARVLDIGTGSGCIAITLKRERPDLTVTAVDLCADALAMARANADRLEAAIDWHQGDLFTGLAGRAFDLIVSNPPYIAASDPHLSRGDVRFEPRGALVSGADGLAHIRRLVAQAPDHLATDGWLLLEHGYDQGEAVPALLTERGYVEVFLAHDLAGQPRVSGGRRPAAG